MPNGDSTTNVGDLVEMESQVHLILQVAGEINHLEIGDVRTDRGRGRHPRKFKLIKRQSNEIRRHA